MNKFRRRRRPAPQVHHFAPLAIFLLLLNYLCVQRKIIARLYHGHMAVLFIIY